MQSYEKLKKVLKKISLLKEVEANLSWDSSVLLPQGASNTRAEQLSLISTLVHKNITSQNTQDLIYESEEIVKKSGNQWDIANVRQAKHMLMHANALPEKLVKQLSMEAVKCEMKWRKARKNNDFKIISKSLENLLKLAREEAQHKSEFLGLSLYESLLDGFDQNRRTNEIDTAFGELKEFLPNFIKQVAAKQKCKPKLSGDFPVKNQKKLCKYYMEAFGFNFKRGRLDKSTHPFCNGTQDDVRITTRYDNRNFLGSLMGVIHETGHALYEQNLPSEYNYQPVGYSNGMSIHEGQSLFLEKQIGRSSAFLEHLYDHAAQFISIPSGFSLDDLISHVQHVEPSFIRVDADEVTYPAHIIVRYELEKAMIEGDLSIADLPQAFNDGIEKLLGIRPTNDSEGCLQDIHWYSGAFGYFPTYTLGATTAAQLMHKVKSEMNVDKLIRNGEFLKITRWNSTHIHQKGCLYEPKELLKNATGEYLNIKYLIEHLKNRYL